MLKYTFYRALFSLTDELNRIVWKKMKKYHNTEYKARKSMCWWRR